MRHVRQKFENDCGYAVGAMLTGLTYLRFGALDRALEATHGLYVGEMTQMLTDATGAEWIASRSNRKEIRVTAASLTCRAVVIRRPGDRFGHWVAISESGMIHDPELARPVSPDAYHRGDWLTIASVRRY